MGEVPRKSDGRRVFNTEFKRTTVQRILTGEKTAAELSLGWRTIAAAGTRVHSRMRAAEASPPPGVLKDPPTDTEQQQPGC